MQQHRKRAHLRKKEKEIHQEIQKLESMRDKKRVKRKKLEKFR